MKIHLFSKKSEQIMGMDKFIKGCIKERPYPLTKDQSLCCPKIARSLEELKKKHKGKIVINQSPTGIILTTADDIFESVDAVVQEIISIETDNVQSAHVTEKHVKRDGQLVNKPEYKDCENQRKTEGSLQSKRDVTSEKNTKNPKGFKSEFDVNFDQLEAMNQPEIKVKPRSYGISKIEDKNKSVVKHSGFGTLGLHITVENDKAQRFIPREPQSTGLHDIMRGFEDRMETCPICLDTPEDPVAFNKCGHVLCRQCMEITLRNKPICPVCGTVYGIITGHQPPGTMQVNTTRSCLPGFRNHGTIEIMYSFPCGIQMEEHPNPGQPYQGTKRRAYLPDNKEGRTVLSLLIKAFDRRLVFTIGRSVTTGAENTVTWNDIFHKTNKDGGPQNYGYPDPDYLRRVQEELAAKGVTGDT